jgi:hypothetical protein
MKTSDLKIKHYCISYTVRTLKYKTHTDFRRKEKNPLYLKTVRCMHILCSIFKEQCLTPESTVNVNLMTMSNLNTSKMI